MLFSFPEILHSSPLEISESLVEWKVLMVLTYVDQFQIAETHVLIMEDMLVFLQEKDQKYPYPMKVIEYLYASIASFFRGLKLEYSVTSVYEFI